MKQVNRPGIFKYTFLLFLATVANAIVWAQDSTVTATTQTTTTTEQTWYTEPWVWVVGGAVLILLIVALVRGNRGGDSSGRTDKVTITKTTSSESN